MSFLDIGFSVIGKKVGSGHRLAVCHGFAQERQDTRRPHAIAIDTSQDFLVSRPNGTSLTVLQNQQRGLSECCVRTSTAWNAFRTCPPPSPRRGEQFTIGALGAGQQQIDLASPVGFYLDQVCISSASATGLPMFDPGAGGCAARPAGHALGARTPPAARSTSFRSLPRSLALIYRPFQRIPGFEMPGTNP